MGGGLFILTTGSFTGTTGADVEGGERSGNQTYAELLIPLPDFSSSFFAFCEHVAPPPSLLSPGGQARGCADPWLRQRGAGGQGMCTCCNELGGWVGGRVGGAVRKLLHSKPCCQAFFFSFLNASVSAYPPARVGVAGDCKPGGKGGGGGRLKTGAISFLFIFISFSFYFLFALSTFFVPTFVHRGNANPNCNAHPTPRAP